MSLTLAPTIIQPSTEPAVGIFWRVDAHLLVERTPVALAEPYGDCLTHPGGHYERWEVWQALGLRGLRASGYPERIAYSEYDHWPRGRVVYEVLAKRFMLYTDRRLQRPEIILQLRQAFGLTTAAVVVRGDPHYR